MNNDKPVISRHLNILGCLTILVAISFLVVFFNIENGNDSGYFLNGAFTCLIISILAFGFSKIIELLDKIAK